jgi:hypothetical protein
MNPLTRLRAFHNRTPVDLDALDREAAQRRATAHLLTTCLRGAWSTRGVCDDCRTATGLARPH